MSFDPNQQGTPYQQPYLEPKKSSAKWWIFGGIGCFLMLLLCGGGMAWMAYFSVNMVMNNDGYKSAVATVETSEQVKTLLGEPITFGTQSIDQKQDADGLEIKYTVPISGPKGTGTMRCVCNMDQNMNWTAEEIEVEVDGEIIKLDSIDNLDLDIDPGE